MEIAAKTPECPSGADDAAWLSLVNLPQRWTVPAFPLKSADFIKRGIEKGPALGAAMRAAEAAWIEADFPGDAAALDRIMQSRAPIEKGG